MAHQEEPLYDFPEPTLLSEQRFLGHQRGRGSLRSINILDRLLLTVPVWLQLSINPATALHIMQREPPGTFLVRKSRTSQKNVLCVRLADDHMPSFVQQFGIREENSTLSLETSAISFPDLPRLISFYCVSRDVLPFPLELPEAIAKATSHKELESISHMGIEFWSSHLNVRGPREAPKPFNNETKQQPDTLTSVLPAAASNSSLDSAPQSDSNNQLNTALESDTANKHPAPSPTVFQKFCPITTRSPKELNYGSGLGALCFINPLFLQSQDPLSRRRMFQRSVKIRVSTETATLLSPPLVPPPPPPLMPKSKGKCKGQNKGEGTTSQPSKELGFLSCNNPSPVTQNGLTSQNTQLLLLQQTQAILGEVQLHPSLTTPHFQPEIDEHGEREPGQIQAVVEGVETTTKLQTVAEQLSDDSEYKEPSPVISLHHSPSLSPYLSPMVPPLYPKVSRSCSPQNSPSVSPSFSPYQSPSLSPKVSHSLSPHDSLSASPSLSPHQSPTPSRKVSFSPSIFLSPSFPQLEEQAYHTPATLSRSDQKKSEREAEEESNSDDHKGEVGMNEELQEQTDEVEEDLVLQINTACLNNSTLCKSVT